MNRIIFSSLQNTGIFTSIYRKPRLSDEPKLYGFGVEFDLHKVQTDGELPDPYASGTSYVELTAILRAIFEGIERFNLAEFRFNDFIFDSYEHMTLSHNVISPSNFCYFNTNQLRKFRNKFSYADNAKFYWTNCRNVQNDQDTYIPSQVIYCPYKYQMKEKVLTFPITTGSSVAMNKRDAIYRGLCEVIERDSFITSYLLRLHPQKIIYKNTMSDEIATLREQIIKYDLDIQSYVLTSDFNIPTVLSVIIDRTKEGPALCIGLKTDWNLNETIISSMEEACQIRQWIRLVMIDGRWKGSTYTDVNMLKRAYLWKDVSALKKLGFILHTRKKLEHDRYSGTQHLRLNKQEKYNMIIREFKRLNIPAFYKDVTSKRFGDMGISAVKCVVPYLHPMYIDQNYPYLGGSRLRKLKRKYLVTSLNTYPHPFL